jgi:Arc/MetJ-type ribon-helix-helix transcriptional regulator
MGNVTDCDLHLKISAGLCHKLRRIAEQDETSVSEVVRRALRQLVRERVPEATSPPALAAPRTQDEAR